MFNIDPRQFLSTYQEWHALVIGFSEAFAPWPPRHPLTTGEDLKVIQDEHHYYLFGRALGMLALAGLLVAIVNAIK